MFCFVEISKLTLPPVSTTNNTSSSGNGAVIGGAVGGAVSLLFIGVLCIMIWCIRRSYKNKKAYNISHKVHYKPNELVTNVAFNPNLCYDAVTECSGRADTTFYNDYNVITNTATSASKLNNFMYIYSYRSNKMHLLLRIMFLTS